MQYPEDYINKIICGDCLEVMKGIPDKAVDLVLTDPPYNASNSNISCIDKHYATVDEEWDKGFEITFLHECLRVLREGGTALIFCSYHLLGDYLKSGYKVQQIIHWTKTNPFPAIAKVYTPNVEYIIWFIKSNPYYFNKKESGQNIITTNVCQGKERTSHPTQKPQDLINKLLLVHSEPENVVLDPFLGSGTTSTACKSLGRRFIGIEQEPKYCEIAQRRLSQEYLFT